MTDVPAPAVEEAASVAMWEQRHKHAGFYQTQINAVQQASLAFNTAGTVIITLSVAMTKLSDFARGGDFWPIFLGAIGWAILTFVLTNSFQRSAERVRAAYEKEHALLFPSLPPYRLESYLLRYADKKARR